MNVQPGQHDCQGSRAPTQSRLKKEASSPRPPITIQARSLMTIGYPNSPTANNGNGASPTTTVSGYTWTYNAENRLRTSTLNSNTTTYIYDDGGQLAAECSTAPNTAANAQDVTTDARGSTRLVTASGGAVVSYHEYLPLGAEILGSVGSRSTCYSRLDSLTQRFTGKERDQETGLDYFEAKYRSAAEGRFTSPDEPFIGQSPLNPRSWNLDKYGLNNPLRYLDPTGRVQVIVVPIK